MTKRKKLLMTFCTLTTLIVMVLSITKSMLAYYFLKQSTEYIKTCLNVESAHLRRLQVEFSNNSFPCDKSKKNDLHIVCDYFLINLQEIYTNNNILGKQWEKGDLNATISAKSITKGDEQ